MSLTRRLAAGLPAVGVTAFAALAFAGTPAIAATADAAGAGFRPAVLATPCPAGTRAGCTYSNNTTAPGGDATAPASGHHGAGNGGYGNGNGNGNGDTPHRGQPGYGGQSPLPTPSETTPNGNTDTVPPGGVSPTTVPSPGSPGGGVSPAGTLPLTGAPAGATIAFGAALLAAGAGAIWYTRRRRTV